MYYGYDIVFDHGDYSTVRVCRECPDDDEDECIKYNVVRYRLAWIGITCSERKVVAVLRNLVVIEEDDRISKIVYYDIFNVIESEKLFDIVKERRVANTIAKRKLVELVEKLKCSRSIVSSVATMSLWLDLLKGAMK
jgi:hypothetical protein